MAAGEAIGWSHSPVPGIGWLPLAARAVLDDYPAAGLADAMNVVPAREFRTNVIATGDHRHFRVIRPRPACRLPAAPRRRAQAASCDVRLVRWHGLP
jgi:hypothetical protein